MEAIRVVNDEELWRASEWYRALALVERLGPREAAGASTLSPRSAAGDSASARMNAWKAQKPFQQHTLFAKRLAADSLSERDLLFLLGEPAERLKARVGKVPEWLVALREAFGAPDEGDSLRADLEAAESEHPLRACLPALAPLFGRGLAALSTRIEALRREHAHPPFDDERLASAFVANIAPGILFRLSKPVILELHVARLKGCLRGESSEARFQDFVRHLEDEGLILELLRKYPVLARQLVIEIDQWAAYLGEFLTHLCLDWDAICRTFAPAGDPGPLIEVDAGRGDRHRNGRSVLLLRFSSGLRLLYKPKPLAVDVHFQQLLSWLNARGAEPGLRPMTIIDRGEYGWSEYIAASPCRSEAEVERFFERQGTYLAILYALDAADFHNENLIAAGEHPTLVDLEALFHPHVHGSDPILSRNLAAGALDQSVWQVGLLPRRVWSDEDSLGVDMSGLGGEPGQMNPHPTLSLNAEGGDEMRIGRRHVELPVSTNRPRLNGDGVDVLAYRAAIVAGFERMYRLLCRHRDALLREWLPRFADDPVRVVVRSTNVYGLLLYESFHPDLLRDALDRDRFFDRLWGEAAQRPYLERVIPAERHDLLRGDIPVFTTSPRSRAILTSEGVRVDDFLAASSLDLVRQRIERLGEGDLVKQMWIIEASLATLKMDRGATIARPSPLPPGSLKPAGARLPALATGLGQRIEELALQSSSGAYWLGVGPLDETTWALFPAGTDLYAGTSGIALFLGYLGAVTGETSHTRLARHAVESLRAEVSAARDAAAADPAATESWATVGGFEGLGSVIYVLAHLAALWEEPDLLHEAEELVESLPALVSNDRRLDIIYGSAGAILSLLSLDAVRPSPRTLEVAIGCGDRLLETAQPMPQGVAWTTLEGQPPLGGFSHGTAGIAFSLLRLGRRSGEPRFRECALRALAYDRSLFDLELGNWADLRVFPQRATGGDSESARPSMVAWCHGAAGVGLGRLGALDELDDRRTRQEIDDALSATIDYGFALNHSLCHGALGNLELLLVAARVLNRPRDHLALEAATAAVVASLDADGPLTGVPLGVETPGFMTGLAGIGYELLRLAEPDTVPSALLLAPPSPRA